MIMSLQSLAKYSHLFFIFCHIAITNLNVLDLDLIGYTKNNIVVKLKKIVGLGIFKQRTAFKNPLDCPPECKDRTERLQAGIWTQELLTTRQKC